MIIYILFCVVNSTQLKQSFTIKQDDKSQLAMSIVKQFSKHYLYGEVQVSMSIQSSHKYQLIYLPDTSSEQYYCFVIQQLPIQQCYQDIQIIDDENHCQQVILNFGTQTIICNNFSNLIYGSSTYKVQIDEGQQIMSPCLIFVNSHINDLQIELTLNIMYEPEKDEYEIVIVLTVVLVSILVILSLLLCLSCSKYKKLKMQIKYQVKRNKQKIT